MQSPSAGSGACGCRAQTMCRGRVVHCTHWQRCSAASVCAPHKATSAAPGTQHTQCSMFVTHMHRHLYCREQRLWQLRHRNSALVSMPPDTQRTQVCQPRYVLFIFTCCREQCLWQLGYQDIFKSCKDTENAAALDLLPKVSIHHRGLWLLTFSENLQQGMVPRPVGCCAMQLSADHDLCVASSQLQL
jgi:hypothetical protein